MVLDAAMSLAKMRRNGVRSLWASCLDCHHHATVNVDDQPGRPVFLAAIEMHRMRKPTRARDAGMEHQATQSGFLRWAEGWRP